LSKTILVVEDDKVIQRMLVETLEAEGFAVIAEKDGDWALRTFESKEVDFLILDILIPVMNGFQVAEKIRKTPKGKSVPILMISGIYRGLNHRQEAIRKYGVVDYLDKPLRMEKIREILRNTFSTAYPSPVAAKAEREAIDQKAPEPYASPDSHRERKEVEEGAREFGGAVRQGSLADTSFPELLAQLYREKSDGALLLRHDKVKKIVYFKAGYPVFVKSNLLNECLGKVMVREKMITEAECEESIVSMKKSKRQQGTVLIEMGCISPHNLQYALSLQLRVKLMDLFAWEDGDFQHNPKSETPPATISLESSTASLIYAGIRETYGLPRLRGLLDGFLDRYVVPNPDPWFRFQEMDLDEDEERFFLRLKGKQTLREILDLGLDKERGYQIIYALVCSGIVNLKDSPPLLEILEENEPEEEEVLSTPTMPGAPPSLSERIKGRLDEGGGVPVPMISESGRVSDIGRGGAGLSAEERTLREDLVKRMEEMRTQNYFEILGVSKTAKTDEIKKAYFALAKKYHPDRLSVSTSSETRVLADEIFNFISRAHDVLVDEEQRKTYLEELSSGVKDGVSNEVSKILSAEGIFQQGEAALRRRDYPLAKQHFEEVTKLCPEEGEFHAYLGWTLFQSDPKNEEAIRLAREHLNQAISLNPKVDKAYLFLGYIYKALDYQEMAEHEFEKAIQCNPDCTEALRELRLLNMRKKDKKDDKKKGGFFRRG
jgi:DNA-binding response OmpR family regulator/curved DNA-binding protein CbpA